MGTGWLTCNLEVLLPHSPCRFTTANAPANRQMPIASVVMGSYRKKKNMRKLQLLLVIGMFCYSCADKQKTQKKVNSTITQADSLVKTDNNQEKEIIKKVSTSFYDWYLKRISSLTDTTAYDYVILKDENGKCKVDFEPYFNQLRQLKTISKKFMDKELERAKDCVKHIKTVDWVAYQDADAYEYEDYCPDCSYMYWIKSQEFYSGVEIFKMEKKDNFWYTTLRLYNDFENKRTHYDYFYPIIKIENENGKWMMTEITLKQNK